MPRSTPKGFIKLIWCEGEGAGTIFTGDCDSQLLSVPRRWQPYALKFSHPERKGYYSQF